MRKFALLTASDMGRGWLSGPALHPNQIISSCTGRLDPRESDLVETGSAGEFSSKGVMDIMQTVAVYPSALEANAAWSRTMAASINGCMKEALRHVAVRPVHARQLHPPAGGARAAGYRVVGRFEDRGRTITMYFDQLIVHRGKTVTRVFLTSFQHPFNQRFETTVTRRIEARLLRAPLAE